MLSRQIMCSTINNNNKAVACYVVLWLPATTTASCYGSLIRPLRRAMVACYGHYVVLFLLATKERNIYELPEHIKHV